MTVRTLESNRPVSFINKAIAHPIDKAYAPVPKYDMSKPVKVRRNGSVKK